MVLISEISRSHHNPFPTAGVSRDSSGIPYYGHLSGAWPTGFAVNSHTRK